MNNKRNPYYKEYKKNPLVKKPHYTFKLPEEVKADFDEYLRKNPFRKAKDTVKWIRERIHNRTRNSLSDDE